MMRMKATVVAVLLLGLECVAAFYVPVQRPNDFQREDHVVLHVDKLTSIHTQLPYDYYYLPFCRPEGKEYEQEIENIGEILAGDRIRGSKYEVRKCMLHRSLPWFST